MFALYWITFGKHWTFQFLFQRRLTSLILTVDIYTSLLLVIFNVWGRLTFQHCYHFANVELIMSHTIITPHFTLTRFTCWLTIKQLIFIHSDNCNIITYWYGYRRQLIKYNMWDKSALTNKPDMVAKLTS